MNFSSKKLRVHVHPVHPPSYGPDISSFESPMPYLFSLKLKNSIVALLRYIIIAQTYGAVHKVRQHFRGGMYTFYEKCTT